MADVEDISKGDVEYVMVDCDGDVHFFESEEDLEEYLEDADFSDDEIADIRVFEVNKEYRVVQNSEFELEEV